MSDFMEYCRQPSLILPALQQFVILPVISRLMAALGMTGGQCPNYGNVPGKGAHITWPPQLSPHRALAMLKRNADLILCPISIA